MKTAHDRKKPVHHGFDRAMVPVDRIQDMSVLEQPLYIAHSECVGCADVSDSEAEIYYACPCFNALVYSAEAEEFKSMLDGVERGTFVDFGQLVEFPPSWREEIIARIMFYVDFESECAKREREYAGLHKIAKETALSPKDLLVRFPSLSSMHGTC